MALSVKVGSFSLPNVIGSVAVTGLGFQPEALIVFSPGDLGFNVNYDRMYGGIGVTTGPLKQACVSWFSRANVAPSITASQTTDNRIYVSINNSGAGAPFIEQQASLVSFDPDGFTVSCTAAGQADLLCYIAFSGLTGADCGITSVTALGPTNTVTTGFTPDLLLFGSSGLYSPINTLSGGLTAFMGIEDGTGRNSSTWYRDNGVAITANVGGSNSSTLPIRLQDFSGTSVLEASINFLADGFEIDKEVNPASNQQVLYLALAGLKTKTDSVLLDEPLGGTKAVTGVGFQPVGGIFQGRLFTNTTGSNACRYNFGFQTLPNPVATNEGKACSWNGSRNATQVQDRTRATNNRAIAAYDGANALETADIQSWDADGFTVRNFAKTITASFPVDNLFYTVFQEGTNNNFIPTSGNGCERHLRCRGSLGFLVGEYEPFCINTCGQILTETYDDIHEKVYDLGADYLDFSVPDTLLIQEFANFTYRDDPIDVTISGSDDPLFLTSDQETLSVQAVDLVGPERRDLVASLSFTTMRRYWKVTIVTAEVRRVIVGDIFLGKTFVIDRSPKYPAVFTVRDELIEARRFPVDLELEFTGVSPIVKQQIDDMLVKNSDIVPFWLYDPQDAVLLGRIVHKVLIDQYSVQVNDSGVYYDLKMSFEELI